MKGNILLWLIIIAVVVVVGILMFNGNSDSTDNSGSTTQSQDEIPTEELSDLNSDDEVFAGIDEGVDSFG